MKIFACAVCHQPVFFENVACTKCGHALAYLPDHGVVSAMDPDPQRPGVLVALAPAAERGAYRRCKNDVDFAACNWAVPVVESDAYCRACRLNEIIPDLSDPNASVAWKRIEAAKRRLVHTLLALRLPVEPRAQSPGGVAFAFKADDKSGQKVLTGHDRGLITLNIDEADSPFREKMREQLGEAYRTLLGHFRHEIGHYYWDRLIRPSDDLEAFRREFGDERADYAAAVDRHYKQGPPPDWGKTFVSAYASMHPWEDWAETWAHYLHMVDALDTARSYGLATRPQPVDRPEKDAAEIASIAMTARRLDFDDFDDLMAAWVPLTLVLNSLNRSMGLPDPYPFVLSEAAVRKLRFVHGVVEKPR